MQILESIEARWFFAPDPAREALLAAWFEHATEEGQRVDSYLRTGRADLGFKVRRVAGAQRKVETKYLIGALGALEIAPSLSGRTERWKKLSLDVDDPTLQQDGSWIALRKERRQRKFAYDGVHAFEVGPTERVAAGAGLELTRIHFEQGGREQRATTLAIEAFGPSAELPTIFEHTVKRAFADAPEALALRATDSLSYPAWLEELAALAASG